CEEVDLELGRRLHELLRLLSREWQLELRRVGTILVVGDVEAIDVRHAGHLELLPARASRLVHPPDHAAFDKILEAGLTPGPLVMAVGGVEDSSLALRAEPRPWLTTLAVNALHDDGAVTGR